MGRIRIEMDKTDFAGGETVQGRVILDIEKKIPIRGVRIRFCGFERAIWSEGGGRTRVVYDETRILFDEEQTLCGDPPLTETEIIADALKGLFSKDRYYFLEIGTYTYDFTYQLLENLPGDFESEGGSRIAYEITAYVDIPLKVDISATKRLTVYETGMESGTQPVDLKSSHPLPPDPDHPVEIQICMDKDTVYPGDAVKAKMTMTKPTTYRVDAVTVTLDQILSLSAKGKQTTRTSAIRLLEVEHPPAAKHEVMDIDLAFFIPDDLYCTVTSSKLVQVRYELVYTTLFSWGLCLENRVPVRILEKAGMPSGIGRA